MPYKTVLIIQTHSDTALFSVQYF